MRTRKMRNRMLLRSFVLAGLGALVVAVAAFQLSYGVPVFVGVPALLGFFSIWPQWPDQESEDLPSVAWSLMPVAMWALLVIMIRLEGIVCLVMAAPLAIPFALIGGKVAQRLNRRKSAKRKVSVMGALGLALLVPGGIIWGPHGPSHQVFRVSTSIVIDAPPEVVWRHIATVPTLPPPKNVLFRAGLAYPTSTEMDGSGVGAARRCILSTGTMDETVTDWEPGRLLRFDVRSTPAAMTELSPWPSIDPPHLHGYYESRQGEFRLTALSGGRTRVDGTSWYQHGLEPAQYWRLWSDYVVRLVQRRVLENVKKLSEEDIGRTTAAKR